MREDVKDGHHDNNEVVQRTKQVFKSLKDDTHRLDLVQQSQQFEHANEDNNLKDLDSVVVVRDVTICFEEEDGARDVEDLAEGLRPDSKVIHVCFHGSGDRDISDCLEEHQEVE